MVCNWTLYGTSLIERTLSNICTIQYKKSMIFVNLNHINLNLVFLIRVLISHVL